MQGRKHKHKKKKKISTSWDKLWLYRSTCFGGDGYASFLPWVLQCISLGTATSTWFRKSGMAFKKNRNVAHSVQPYVGWNKWLRKRAELSLKCVHASDIMLSNHIMDESRICALYVRVLRNDRATPACVFSPKNAKVGLKRVLRNQPKIFQTCSALWWFRSRIIIWVLESLSVNPFGFVGDSQGGLWSQTYRVPSDKPTVCYWKWPIYS